MSKITLDQMRAMRYGIHSVGSFVHAKLRYTALLAMRIVQDNEMRSFMNDISVHYNARHTHAHIVFIAHQNTGLVQLLHRVEQRQRHLIKKHELEMEQRQIEYYADQDANFNPEC